MELFPFAKCERVKPLLRANRMEFKIDGINSFGRYVAHERIVIQLAPCKLEDYGATS